MSEDLADLKRLKITPRTRAWLTAETLNTGRSAQDIVRDYLDAKAGAAIHGAKILTALADGQAHVRDGAVHIGDGRGRSGK